MDKQGQLLLSYADNALTGNISLYESFTRTVAEIVLSGTPDHRFNLVSTIIVNLICESGCTHCVLNINDLCFYQENVVNEVAVGGIVAIINAAIEQGANIAIVTDDSFFRNIISLAFNKHKRCSKVRAVSTTEDHGIGY